MSFCPGDEHVKSENGHVEKHPLKNCIKPK